MYEGTNIFNIDIIFEKNTINTQMSTLISEQKKAYICAVNANIIIEANNNNEYKKIINESDFNICDGSIIALLYSKIYGEKVDSYPGPDFFIDTLSERKYSSFFLGSEEHILYSLKAHLITIDPSISNMEFYSPPFAAVDSFDYKGIAKIVNKSAADIIWISLGAPKQEEFMYRLKPYLSKGVMVGVGAAFTFYGDDTQKRAPLMMRSLHLEWLYRLIKDPKKTFSRIVREIYFLPGLIYKEMKKRKSFNG